MGNLFLRKQHFDPDGALLHLAHHTLWVLDEGKSLGYYGTKFRMVRFSDRVSWFQCFLEFLAQGSSACMLVAEEMTCVSNQVVEPGDITHSTVEAVDRYLKEAISPRFAKELLSHSADRLKDGWELSPLSVHFQELYRTTSDVNLWGEFADDWPHGCQMEKVYKVFTTEGWKHYAVSLYHDSWNTLVQESFDVCEVDVAKGQPALRFLKA